MPITRKDITQETAPWSDSIVWYAVGVNAMMQRAITDPASWWYFAAIHGQDIAATDPGMPGWQNLITPPNIVWGTFSPAAKYPAMWDQCQHGSWYFPPWHRGYLMALEAQLQADITAQGGPANWALPYWNYWNSQGFVPVEFTQPSLPATTASGAAFPASLAGKPNPLYVSMRYGFVDTFATDVTLGISSTCLQDADYTGGFQTNDFGGAQTPFSHDASSGTVFGGLENNPHNTVHVDVGAGVWFGGATPTPGSGQNYSGLMAVPDYAALDPIFYLHHAMIDGMWAYWNTLPNSANPSGVNDNPNDPSWLNPVFSQHPGMFRMPWESAGAGVTWHYTPQDVTRLGALQVTLSNGNSVAYSYTYDFLANPATATAPFTPPAQTSTLSVRLTRLRAPAAALAPTTRQPKPRTAELLGANTGPHPVLNQGTTVSVPLDSPTLTKVSASLKRAAPNTPPDRVFLKLEGIKGTSGSTKLGVFIHAPSGGNFKVGTVGLFGLTKASSPNAQHAGTGLAVAYDISAIVDQLHLSDTLQAGTLSVLVVPSRPIPGGSTVTVDKISIYRATH